jgi:hypothetical protein
MRGLSTLIVVLLPVGNPISAQGVPGPVGVVSRINVLSDKAPDVSSLDAWKKSFLREGMSDGEKALAAWRSTVMFQHQDAPPYEHLQDEQVVQDPIKIFNVYGYSFCSVASCDIAALARYAGLKARGWAINGHSVPEVYWDGAWHMLDASLINYFPKADGSPASVEEILAAVGDWYAKNPGYRGRDSKLRAFQSADGWTGWKRGPSLLARSPFLDAGGWWPAKTHGWYATMQEYDGTYGGKGKPYLYEYGYSQGYQVNIQLRPGERLIRNWSNKGLHVNGKDGAAPACLTMKTGSDSLGYTPAFGDVAPGRIGNGILQYEMPVKGGGFRTAALAAENLEENAVRVKDETRPGVLVLRMPSSYVYLTGTLTFTAAVGEGGSMVVSYSENNGADWREIARATAAGQQRLDLTGLVLRRYDYRLKFEFHGKGSGLDALKIVHDIQHSQRALPALAKGANTITFSAGPPEGTITIEGAINPASKGKQLLYTDFHPEVSGFDPNLFVGSTGKGSITFPIATPGDIVRLRFGTHYRARDARDGIDYHLSFDQGRTWKMVARAEGPTAGDCKYVRFEEIPPGARAALVRFSGTTRNATGIFNFRIDADYREPSGGFRPVQVTYTWDEDGESKRHVHIARKPHDTYTIECRADPVMKAIVLDLAE